MNLWLVEFYIADQLMNTSQGKGLCQLWQNGGEICYVGEGLCLSISLRNFAFLFH